MNERTGVLIAVLSSALGGGAAVATRFLIGGLDPIALAAVRFGGGALCLLPLALLLRPKWPARADWPAVAGLGFLFYAVFIVFYNLALSYTTVGRGTLALSTLPLMTMVVGALLGVEALSARKTAGVLLATGGVALALTASLGTAPDGAWRGDLIMAGATLCMALYNVFARPFIARSSALGFLTLGMAVGGGALITLCLVTGRTALLLSLDTTQMLTGIYLAVGGGALGFFLWVVALRHASPTRVANTITVNPLIAMAAGTMLLGEPVTATLVLGLVAVCAGVWVATT
ncbi:MAG: permease [Alphaproteobacteria bacterium RIFCSPHIGHO2_12_FULL_66_14]|jgi:drug/metabolite transporter (DMT)-like permease|nr:MAG: permease [Alphaproteobacteria bacterium RIFCSPHIGHO2_12_FULL_66_14]